MAAVLAGADSVKPVETDVLATPNCSGAAVPSVGAAAAVVAGAAAVDVPPIFNPDKRTESVTSRTTLLVTYFLWFKTIGIHNDLRPQLCRELVRPNLLTQ